MKATNVSALAVFPASAVIPPPKTFLSAEDGETPEALADRENALRKRMMEVSLMEAGPAKDQAVGELEASMPDEYRTQLKAFGARLPSDNLDLTITLGSFFFDLYALVAKAPAAPLAQAIYQKKLQDLAVRLEESELSLSQEEVSIIKPSLENEAVWDKAVLSASVKVGDEKRYIQLSNKAAPYFAPVLNAAVTYLMNYDKPA